MPNVKAIAYDSQSGDFIFYVMWLHVANGLCTSGWSRSAASDFDQASQGVDNTLDGGSPDVGEAYQNSSQMAKGALIGGTSGAIVGGLTPGIGILPGQRAAC